MLHLEATLSLFGEDVRNMILSIFILLKPNKSELRYSPSCWYSEDVRVYALFAILGFTNVFWNCEW